MKPLRKALQEIRTVWKTLLLLAGLALATVACSDRPGDFPFPQSPPRPVMQLPAADNDESEGRIMTALLTVPSRRARLPRRFM
ncbi:hypothetical protein [Noviherbaspirillum saxi]|uniref:Lipoprotein-attachment site-containing protein n=1 Tax=Noviherbaspirillum saxi TaxID=2320863 RepID=A0A3A3FUT9_9BURK|nr:hypothetical protein [Noviherbaspirillum saxi]RJF99094.1 hypothetical protein D3871_11640 [Noviherbaspirillum saxi]